MTDRASTAVFVSALVLGFTGALVLPSPVQATTATPDCDNGHLAMCKSVQTCYQSPGGTNACLTQFWYYTR